MSDEREVTKWGQRVFMTEEQIAGAGALQTGLTAYFDKVLDPNYVPEKPWEGPPVTPPPEAYVRLLATPADALVHEIASLHGPTPVGVRTDGTVYRWVCEGCDAEGYDSEEPEWPCQTTRLIAQRQGVEVSE
jgi:hypothetical protein